VRAHHGLEGGFIAGESSRDASPLGRVAIGEEGERVALAGLAMR
jgi:hypothetical protein